MRGIGFGLITFAEICGGTAGLVWATAAALGLASRPMGARMANDQPPHRHSIDIGLTRSES